MLRVDWQTWNDGTVPNLAQTIFDGRRYDLLPILADALEEAGYPDAALPARFRTPLAPVTAVRLLAPIVGGDLAESVKWLENLAAELGPADTYEYGEVEMTYEDLMGFAKKWVDSTANLEDRWGGTYTTERGSEHWRSVMYRQNDKFWDHYENVTGETTNHPEAFFSCGC